jgi:uncharacterized protein DUF6894
MPLYFFHFHHLENRRDPEGIELPDVHAAWREATSSAGELLKEMDGDLRPGHEWFLQVNDEFENTLLEIHIKPIAKVPLNRGPKQ